MKLGKAFFVLMASISLIFPAGFCQANGNDYSNSSSSGGDDTNKKILKQGLLGAGVGAISASASGGKAGKGALIGAGTNVIGGALLDTLMGGGSQPRQQPAQQVQYVQQAPVQYVQQPAPQYVQQAPQYSQNSYPVQPPMQTYRSDPQPVYVQQAPAYAPPPQEDPTKKILKQGLLGAGVGAISASASGGKAGQGALIGAGTNVIGGALLDTLMGGGSPQQQQPQPVYYQQQAPVQQQYQQQPSQSYGSSQPRKKILRKYDSDGNVISEEEVWE